MDAFSPCGQRGTSLRGFQAHEARPALADRLVPELEEGRPARLQRLREQLHPGLGGCAVALAVVAAPAGEHAVLPVRVSALRARHDVVDRELRSPGSRAAVLAGVPVAPEEVA